MAMVGRGGLEPPTSRLSGVRSNHLSYRPQCQWRDRDTLTQADLAICGASLVEPPANSLENWRTKDPWALP